MKRSEAALPHQHLQGQAALPEEAGLVPAPYPHLPSVVEPEVINFTWHMGGVLWYWQFRGGSDPYVVRVYLR